MNDSELAGPTPLPGADGPIHPKANGSSVSLLPAPGKDQMGSRQAGRVARQRVARGALARHLRPVGEADPIGLLIAQTTNRIPELLPIRYGRMAASPFAFYRGSAVIMAADLAANPHSALVVQLCGDAHLANFGMFASPERKMLFDLNDFDETLPGPFEWDVKRLTTSVVLAARASGWSDSSARQIARHAAFTYRLAMREFAAMTTTEVWYARLVVDDLVALTRQVAPEDRLARAVRKAANVNQRTSLQAMSRLTGLVSGRRQFLPDPPLLERIDPGEAELIAGGAFSRYRDTLVTDRRHLFDRFHLVDVARKVVGVGSVGTRCYVALFTGTDETDPLVLQIKEAVPAVMEAYLGASQYREPGARVVAGQRLMQAASDIFLGWTHKTDFTGVIRYSYVRQLRDMKFAPDLSALHTDGLMLLAEAAGWTLARAHARSGDRHAIAAYLGPGGNFEDAIAGYSLAYADQAEADHAQLFQAIAAGRLEAVSGV
ncbi:MAG: DUF2252 domain-containing protein [Candidatus Nanopelagicales bacterium]